uniref:Cyclin E2 n=1 Tax=Neogobius melanostomus TaxID=47308 RepID=A0A8C6SQK1_9GOBI
MTKRSGRLQKGSQNVSRQKTKAVKSNKKKSQPPLKPKCEKNEMILEGVDAPCVLASSPHKVQHSVAEPNYMEISSAVLLHPSKRVLDSSNAHAKSFRFMLNHPKILPDMRSILIDWLIEVSEAYTLHRQTLYLAHDYFDRFMLTRNNIDKSLLQLIGITSLFIASKMEEACPPKLSQMAYVTAGTYYEHEILEMELLILKVLRWTLCPETALSWLQLYFQMVSMSADTDLLEPQFPRDTFVQMTTLLDLCIIDINSMDFENRVLAAAVLSHFVEQSSVEKVSGLSKEVLQPCLKWMGPFVAAVQQFGKAPLKDFKDIKPEDQHNIQTHTDYLTMLDNAGKKQNDQFLTPPNSTEKMH